MVEVQNEVKRRIDQKEDQRKGAWNLITHYDDWSSLQNPTPHIDEAWWGILGCVRPTKDNVNAR
jgi:hypothetical protein